MFRTVAKNSCSENPDWREVRRMRALELKQQGWKQRDIAETLEVTPGAVSQWLKRAKDGGKEALRHRSPPGPQSRLTEEQREQLPALIAQGAKQYGYPNNAWTIKRVRFAIQQEFAITYHPAHLGRLLRELGIRIKAPKWQSQKRWQEHKSILLRPPRRKSGASRLPRQRGARVSAIKASAGGM